MDRKYKKHLTPECHYQTVLLADKLINDATIDPRHREIIKMFVYHGMNSHEIARTGQIISKRRAPMSQDMILLIIRHYFPNLEYDETPTRCKRGRDSASINRCRKLKAELLKTSPRCAVCGSSYELELDHILTKYAGGTDDIANLQLLCHACHLKKTKEERARFGWNNKKGGAIYD